MERVEHGQPYSRGPVDLGGRMVVAVQHETGLVQDHGSSWDEPEGLSHACQSVKAV